MTPLPPEILAWPATRSVRMIAQGYLDAAAEAARRLDESNDGEALHDFRVALRRLRTTLRAYRGELRQSLRPRVYRRLGDIADETNRVRDADVALAWLLPLSPALSARERVGLRWLIERIETRRTKRIEGDLAEARRSFRGAERRLRSGLAIDDAGPDRSFATVARGAVVAQARELDEILAAVRAPDGPEVHRARIAAKRLRYLLEPLTQAVPATVAVVARLRALQDRLGAQHDAQELERAVRRGVESVAAERAIRLFDVAISEHATPEAARVARRRDPRPGLIAVARRLRARRMSLFAHLRANELKTAGTWRRDSEAALAAVGVSAPPPIPIPIPHPIRRRRPRRERPV
jgi:CHAD domain-containing protein